MDNWKYNSQPLATFTDWCDYEHTKMVRTSGARSWTGPAPCWAMWSTGQMKHHSHGSFLYLKLWPFVHRGFPTTMTVNLTKTESIEEETGSWKSNRKVVLDLADEENDTLSWQWQQLRNDLIYIVVPLSSHTETLTNWRKCISISGGERGLDESLP